MSIVYIQGKRYQVNKCSNLLEVCLSLGFDLPYFCWHPSLGSVGSCRQCAVKKYRDIADKNGSIVMSCMTPVVDGLIVSLYDDEVQEFRKTILELLMINHPHDCPVCSEGGNCHLQDMTVMTKHYNRRYRFSKRTHLNQYLGPFILHEMNRCINCYRCVRYYKDYADGDDLGVYGAHDNLYFGRFQDGKLNSEFSGNLIEICPTGVFTDKTFSEEYARKWDTQFSPSICVHCGVGCNIVLGERYGKLCRVENRYNKNINGYFLCDRGRFGYGYVNNMNNRFKTPVKKVDEGSDWIVLDKTQAVDAAVDILRNSNNIIGIGSSRASIESNYSLKNLVGHENFYIGINRFEHRLLLLVLDIFQNSGIYIASVKDIESCDSILLLGEDVTQTSSRIALAIRQAVKMRMRNLAEEKEIPAWHTNAVFSFGERERNALFITSIDVTRLDDIASWTYYASLDNQARFGFAIAHALDSSAPKVSNFDHDLMSKVNMVAKSLLNARKPLVISGVNVGSEALISSAVNVAKALKNCGKDVSMSLVATDANSIGLGMIGGGNLDDILDLIDKNVQIDSMIVLEGDLYRHIFSKYIDNILKKVKSLIVFDHQKLLFHNKAKLIFSSASIPESDGTLINQEGRVQRFFRVYNPNYYDNLSVILDSWRWLYEIYAILHSNHEMRHFNFDDVINHIITSSPKLSKIRLASPDASFRVSGQKLARSPNRYSGRTSMCANINVHESRVLEDPDSMFTFSMEGYYAPHPFREHIAFAWSPGWNSHQAWNKFYSETRDNSCLWNYGVRFFDDNISGKNMDWFTNIPDLFFSVINHRNIKNKILRVVPYWHIFGSEELSQRSSAIQECMSEAYVVLNRLDANQFNFDDKKKLVFQCKDDEFSFPLVLSDTLASGCIGIPIGFPGISFAFLGMYVQCIKGIL